MRRLYTALILLALSSSPSPAMTYYYASPSGSGDGLSASTPASLLTAKSLAASAAAGDNVTVYLKGGTYSLPSFAPSGLVFTASDSGLNGHKVYWTAYPSETPVISGATQVTGWTLYDAGKNIWRASVTPGTITRQLYVNGTRAIRSHLAPTSTLAVSAGGGYNIFTTTIATVTTANGGTTYTTTDANMPVFSRPTDLEFTLQPWNWIQHKIGVTGVNRSGNTTTFTLNSAVAAWVSSGQPTYPTYPIALENAYEFLSASTVGNWYINSAAGYLYYVPRAGEDMSTADVRLPLVQTLVSSAFGNPVSNIEFNGIRFEHATWTEPTTTGSYLQMGQNRYYHADNVTASGGYAGLLDIPNAVSFEGGTGIAFRNCTFQHMGAVGVMLGKGVTNSTLDYNTITDVSGNGLVVGQLETVTPSASVKNSYNTITNNTITNCAGEYAGGFGAFIEWADHYKFNHNEISGIPYAGLDVGYGLDVWPSYASNYTTGNEIGWNKIHDVVTSLHDGAAIYLQGFQGSSTSLLQIHDNYIYNVQPNGTQTFAADSSLYPDQGTNWVNYTNNVLVRSANGLPSPWFFSNINTYIGVTNYASSNYATSGMTIRANNNSTIAGISSATGITGTTPSGWPSAAQAIVAAAGPTAVAVPSATPHRLVKGGSMSLVKGGTMKLK